MMIRKEEIENRDPQIREIISVFPVPNLKEDIIDCPNSVCNFSSNVEVYNK